LTFDGSSKIDVTDVPNMLINSGFRITQFAEEAVNLETAFMRITKGVVQ
jgi:ABC-2 type transport system ATP-binding protein